MTTRDGKPYPNRADYYPGIVTLTEVYLDAGPELNAQLPLEHRLLRVEHNASFGGIERVFESHESAADWCVKMKAAA